ncbi:MAG: choloylglycine hydrolase [Clostridiales bacterium]|nr:choloylglycine hydrolase [Clostridiales bacterium]
MCTAATYKTKGFYFGRTLDYEFSYAEEVTVTPRAFPLSLGKAGEIETHYAMIGMAFVPDGYPLYYDAVNEKGLCMAGLNFVGNAYYGKEVSGKTNLATFDFIPYILGKCASVNEALVELETINLTDTPYNDKLPVAQLHWIIADKERAITVESVKEGLRIYENHVGVLTNNPPFPMQMMALNNYMMLSPCEPKNTFSDKIDLTRYSRGMGAIGLPGDLSSESRFVRAAFVGRNSVSGDSEEESVNQFFHILNAVEQPRGACVLSDHEYEITIYTSCCSADKGIYYYTTYENHAITAVDMHTKNLDGAALYRYPIERHERITML